MSYESSTRSFMGGYQPMSTDIDSEVSSLQAPLTESKILAYFFESGNISAGDDKISGASDHLE